MEGETPSIGRRNVKLSWQSGAHTEWKKNCRFIIYQRFITGRQRSFKGEGFFFFSLFCFYFKRGLFFSFNNRRNVSILKDSARGQEFSRVRRFRQ